MLRIVIVDDEALARQGLRQLLAEHENITIVGEAETPDAAVDLIRRQRPDVVLLDIEMHSATEFDVVKDLKDPPSIVFVTAHSKYAVKAYDVSAVDYVLKPVQPKRLAAALAKVETALRSRATDATRQYQAPVLQLKTHNRTVLLRTDAIVAVRAEKDYTNVWSEKRPPILAGQSLGALETLLPKPPFVRLDRSLMINTARLCEIETIDRASTRIRLHGCPEVFLIGRTAAARLRKLQQPPRKGGKD